MPEAREPTDRQQVRTGVDGLDDILRGGLPGNQLYLLEGDPGAGKTTLALQFLLAGGKQGEPCLFISLSETQEELCNSAASHGWNLDGIHILELLSAEEALQPDSRNTMFLPSEVELTGMMRSVLEKAAEIQPARVVFDSLSQLRLLAEHPLMYRRQVLGLKRHFSERQATVLLLDDRTSRPKDMHLYSVAHGVIRLDSETAEYGAIRRRLHVVKLRGQEFREGHHDMAILRGGVEVFPRLVASEHRATYPRQTVSSGLESLDALLGGGLPMGTSTLILGAAGTGKSSLATQYAQAAAARNERAAMFLFDESVPVFRARAAGLNVDVDAMMQTGLLSVRPVDAAELSPGEFAHSVRRVVDEDDVRLVVIDSLNGYLNATPSDRYLALHLRELLMYLGHQGVTTLLMMTQHGMVGEISQSPIDVSYLADSVILLRYFEAFGEVRKAISVIKKRTGRHERTIRELLIDDGVIIGDPLKDFNGVLAGVPEFIGKGQALAPLGYEKSANR